MKQKHLGILAAFLLTVFIKASALAGSVLYEQDFENPVGFVNDGGDVNIFRTVNQLYGEQPAGFNFAQAFTVETLLVTGDQAFGTGYSDPTGTAGNYALGMLSSVQNDLLGFSFNVGNFDFLNVELDVSSIDLSVFGGPFVSGGDIPVFQFTLFDNPSGALTTGSGTILDQLQISGVASAQAVFNWSNLAIPLDASGSQNGNVIFQIDLLQGGYAAMDNFRISASASPIPIPAALPMFVGAIVGLFGFVRNRQKST